MKRIYLFVALALAAMTANAQEHTKLWTLEECINYALDNNIQIKQQNLQVKQSEIEVNSAKNNLLPDLSAGASENFAFGRGLTADNTYANTNTTSTGLNLGTSVPVFQGFRLRNAIKQNELNLKAVTMDLEKAKESMSVSVAQAYIQILYNLEIRDVATNQVSIDSLQVVRLEALLENGKSSQAALAQQKAALAQSRLSVTQAKNNLKIALLDLSQLLELKTPEGFMVVRPADGFDGAALANPEAIYAEALANKPAIRAEELRLDASEYSIKNAKAAYIPTISASGGLGTSYYTSSGIKSGSFTDQMKNNFSQSIGLSLSIPIFNKFQTRNQIRSAELSRTNQEFQLETAKKSLYKEIQQAYYNAVGAQEKFRSSKEANESAKLSYDLVLAKYENGKANITEFNEARDNYLESVSNCTQARYEFLYCSRLLDFYRGGQLTL